MSYFALQWLCCVKATSRAKPAKHSYRRVDKQWVNPTTQCVMMGHVNNIPTMQFRSVIPRNAQSKWCYMTSLTESVWEFRNEALWGTLLHTLFTWLSLIQPKSLYTLIHLTYRQPSIVLYASSMCTSAADYFHSIFICQTLNLQL